MRVSGMGIRGMRRSRMSVGSVCIGGMGVSSMRESRVGIRGMSICRMGVGGMSIGRMGVSRMRKRGMGVGGMSIGRMGVSRMRKRGMGIGGMSRGGVFRGLVCGGLRVAVISVRLHRLRDRLVAQFHVRRLDLRRLIAIRRGDRARGLTLRRQIAAREKNATGCQNQNRCANPNFAIALSHIKTPCVFEDCAEDDRRGR
jgi:hypothetical protein